MTISEMKERKRDLGYSNETIAHLSGVPLGTVQKIFAGITKAPRQGTLEALEKILTVKKERNDFAREETGKTASMLRETVRSYGRRDPGQGNYTLDDYYALPDDRRAELIDGYFYDMSCPTHLHQLILGQLYLQLAPCVEEHSSCEIFFAPSDVRLDRDNKTMVQPDLFIACNYQDDDIRRLNGAPDFIIEILSPSNRAHDLIRKLGKYSHAGVREYWIVDPEKMKIIVYDLEHDDFPTLFTFQDTVPVLISDGKCRVDFARIRERVKKYLPEEKT